jgi:MFS transporter, PAT family, beta-lactamase induction signal transducer AmpG
MAGSTLESVKAAFRSWRIGANALFSLSSGMPLGLVWLMVPAWMTVAGVDIKTVGVLTLVQAPWAFKFLWSPLIDRYRPRFLGGKRGWILIWQLVLAASTGLLASRATSPTVGAVAALSMLIAFASASQDIAIDAYAVESLRPQEHGVAVGVRVMMYRVGMWFTGNIAISIGPLVGWNWTLIIQAAAYLALVPVTLFAPEPEQPPEPPKSLREAAWLPFVGFAQRPMALQIIGFLLLYKLADNLAQTLQRPFLLQVGFNPGDVGVGTGVVTLFATIGGTFLGGLLTAPLGVGRALWFFGFLQAISNLGYAFVAQIRPDLAHAVTGGERFWMYVAMTVEAGTSGMGTGAFNVLLLRLTEKRFSATQYALLSSIFGLGRTITGPIAGTLADALGWRDFFILTLLAAIPGMVMLQRFVPWGSREIPPASLEAERAPRREAGGGAAASGVREPVTAGVVGLLLGTASGALFNALVAALKSARGGKPFDLAGPLASMLHPSGTSQVIDTAGSLLFGVVLGLGAAAYVAARRSARAA